MAQAESVNANQVFRWRRDYLSGQLVEAGESTTSLLPVVIAAAGSEAGVELSAPVCPALCAKMSETGSPSTITVGRRRKSHLGKPIEHSEEGYFFRCVGSFGA